MTEKRVFDSNFHKNYVGGEGVVVDKQITTLKTREYSSQTAEDILAEYRRYVNDPKAELPEVILAELRLSGKIK